MFSGDLGGIPVLTVHADGDGLVTPDNERAYAEVVTHAGHGELLRQLFLHRAGHCTMTLAEALTALEVLIRRLETGAWPELDPHSLNAAAAELGASTAVLQTGEPAEAGFFDFEPLPFLAGTTGATWPVSLSRHP